MSKAHVKKAQGPADVRWVVQPDSGICFAQDERRERGSNQGINLY